MAVPWFGPIGRDEAGASAAEKEGRQVFSNARWVQTWMYSAVKRVIDEARDANRARVTIHLDA